MKEKRKEERGKKNSLPSPRVDQTTTRNPASSSNVPANIPKLYRLDLYQRRRINHHFSDTARPQSSLNKLYNPPPPSNISYLLISTSWRDLLLLRRLFWSLHPTPPLHSLIICLSVSVTLHLQSSWGDHCHLVWRGFSVITRPHIWRTLRLVKSFDLNCLHNHFKKSSWEREGFTNGLPTFTRLHSYSLRVCRCVCVFSVSISVLFLLLYKSDCLSLSLPVLHSRMAPVRSAEADERETA